MATKRFNKAVDKAVKVSAPEPGRAGGTPVSQERVAARAFELHLARGGEPGRELEDWFRAEAELRGDESGDPVEAS
jgi:hypothetical protein